MGQGDEIRMIDILMVEDNPGDVRLTREALREYKIRNEMYVVDDGVKALDFLHKRGDYGDVPTPDMVFLDLNLPRKNGQEVLQEIKNDPELMRLPVIVLTSSTAEEDILRSYDLHANAYVTKPVRLEEFIAAVRAIEEFWLSVVKLPEKK